MIEEKDDLDTHYFDCEVASQLGAAGELVLAKHFGLVAHGWIQFCPQYSSTLKDGTSAMPDPFLFARHYIFSVIPKTERSFDISEKPFVRVRDVGGVVIDSGFTAISPLGRPVWWRIEKRGDEVIYCSSFWLTQKEICDRGLKSDLPNLVGCYPATIETLCRRSNLGV